MTEKKGLLKSEEVQKECKKAVKKLEEIIKEDSKVLLIVGNGISNEDLYTSNIVINFIKDFEKSDPKIFEEIKNTIDNLSKIFEYSSKLDMGKFLECLDKINKYVREKFIYYLIEECCTAEPNEKHFALLSFCSLLNQLASNNNKEIIPRIFTTNYDNLIEKYYNKRKEFINSKIAHKYGLNIDYLVKLTGEKGYIEDHILVPGYYLELEDMAKLKEQGILSIIPIHNSIRIAKCENINCNQTLVSEAVGLGKKVCIYCGKQIEEIIIPTEERRTNINLLNLLEDQAKKANVIIFIGYSFGDDYLISKIAHGMRNTENKQLVLNFCRTSLLKEIKDIVKDSNYVDITYNLPESLYYTNSSFSKRNELIDLFSKICEKISAKEPS